MSRTCPISVAMVLAVVAWSAGCDRKGGGTPDAAATPQKKPPLVKVVPATQQDVARVIQLTGTVEPTKVARMASPAEGPIVKCSVREGDLVTKGQMLVQVGRSGAAVAAVTAAREELSKQAGEFDRIKQLVERGAVASDQLDIAKANLEKARAAVVAAETQVGDYNIEAPWNGVVSRVLIAEGDYVAPRSTLVELFDPESLVLRFAVPEAHSAHVQTGAALAVTIDAYADRKFAGTVVRVYPELDRATRTRTVEAAIAGDVKLVPGMFARIDVTTEVARGAITVPEGAVLINAKGESILFVVKDGAAQLRKVKTGIEGRGRVQIVAGVAAGEQVVVAGNEGLKDGEQVRLPGAGAGEKGAAGKGAGSTGAAGAGAR